jgi:hypothetical protein
MQHKKFSDFAKEEKPLDGSKLKIDDVINREILVTGFKIKESKYKKDSSSRCLTLQFEMEDTKHIIFTGSNVLIDQIEKYNDEMPFLATVKRIDRYYTFS